MDTKKNRNKMIDAYNTTVTNNIDNKSEMSAEVNKEKELEQKVLENIVALVKQANNISAENASIDGEITQYKVDDAQQYIAKIEKDTSSAIERYRELKGMKPSKFWTVGRNKAKAEKTQEVLGDVIDAVDNNANATKALFNDITKMACYSRKLYALGIMGVASNRMVVRRIKMELEHASEEKLSELARQELESVIDDLQRQEALENKLIQNREYLLYKINNLSRNTEEKINELSKIVDQNKSETSEQLINLSDQIEHKITEISNVVEQHHEEKKKLISTLTETIKSDRENSEKDFFYINKKIEESKRVAIDRFSSLANVGKEHDERLNRLENKSFFDSDIFKVLVGFIAVSALFLSIFNYLS